MNESKIIDTPKLDSTKNSRRTIRARRFLDRDKDPIINLHKVKLDDSDLWKSYGCNICKNRVKTHEFSSSLLKKGSIEHFQAKRKNIAKKKSEIYQYFILGFGIFILILLMTGIVFSLKRPLGSILGSSSSNTKFTPSGQFISLFRNDVDKNENNIFSVQDATSIANNIDSIRSSDIPLSINSDPVRPVRKEKIMVNNLKENRYIDVQEKSNTNKTLIQEKKEDHLHNIVLNSILPSESENHFREKNIHNQVKTSITRTNSTHTQTSPMVFLKTQKTMQESKNVMQNLPNITTSSKIKLLEEYKFDKIDKSLPTAQNNKTVGNIDILKSAIPSNYTLQLSSSSNYEQLNSWAKKLNLKNYIVYQTTRNGKAWYVLINGIYGSKDQAKRALSKLPKDIQDKKPWIKPIQQVKSDLQ